MAQAPATPKLKRYALRAAAALAPSLAPRLSPAPSEKAALALRVSSDARPRAEKVIFLVPLVGPHHVGDWQAVSERLAQTVESFRRQDGAWEAVICCQERPPLPDDPRLRWLPFDDPTPGNDKWRKLAALCDDLAARQTGPAYVMSFDADDLLRDGTVSEMLERQEAGYIVETGYVMDHATGDVALAGPRSLTKPLRKPFWKLCGSCMALHHDPGAATKRHLPARDDAARAPDVPLSRRAFGAGAGAAAAALGALCAQSRGKLRRAPGPRGVQDPLRPALPPRRRR